jgi:hypothetical protein
MRISSEILNPPCGHPATLEGESDQGVGGFIIVVRESNSYPGIVAHALGRKYGFTPASIFDDGSFSVEKITPGVLARLRCDPEVESVSYIRRTWTAGPEKP